MAGSFSLCGFGGVLSARFSASSRRFSVSRFVYVSDVTMVSRNRGKPKLTLRDLSRIAPTDEERKAVRKALRDVESPITTAVLGASIVELELETELRNRFRRADDETWKSLTGDVGPLSTFNQQIIAAYGFGILDDVTRDGMDTVRRIRNAFAHTKTLFDFDHELVARELKSVTLPKAKSTLHKRLVRIRRLSGGPREAYAVLCLIMALELLNKRNKRVKANSARARVRRRQKIFRDAIRNPRPSGGLGLLGLFGRYPHVDPSQTLGGGGLLGDRNSDTSASGKKDK